MATLKEPFALDRSLNTTEDTPRNIADVLADELSRITGRNASQVEYDNTESGLTADNVQDALDEIVEDIPTVPSVDIQTAVDEFSTYNGGLLSSLKVALSPNQDLHGYLEPWVGGAGKNKCPDLERGTYDPSDGAKIVNNTRLRTVKKFFIKAGTYYISFTTSAVGKTLRFWYMLWASDAESGNPQTYNSGWINTEGVITISADTYMSIQFGYTDDDYITASDVKAQLELGSAKTDWTPYENICPISGHTQVDVDVSDGQTTQEQVTVNLGGTYYSGTLDVVSGVFTPDTAKTTINDCISNRTTSYDHPVFYGTISGLKKGNPIMYSDKLRVINGKTSASDFASNSENGDFTNNSYNTGATIQVFLRMDDYSDVASLKSAIGDAEIVYELATPTPIQLSPTMVKALVGENHLSAPLDGQEITESKYRELFTWDEVEAYVNAHSGGGSGMNYSTNEQVIGTWIDGKPLYQKSISIAGVSIPTNQTVTIYTQANIKMKYFSGYLTENDTTYVIPEVGVRIRQSGDNIQISSQSGASWTISEGYVTIRYTKTTD